MKSISRRTFLRGAGVCLALPWLEATASFTNRMYFAMRASYMICSRDLSLSGYRPAEWPFGVFRVPASRDLLSEARHAFIADVDRMRAIEHRQHVASTVGAEATANVSRGLFPVTTFELLA